MNDAGVTHSAQRDRRVQLWFQEHLLRAYRAKPAAAAEYARAVGRHFPGLKITVDSEIHDDLSPLPCEQLWTRTP